MHMDGQEKTEKLIFYQYSQKKEEDLGKNLQKIEDFLYIALPFLVKMY